MHLSNILAALTQTGLVFRGGFHPNSTSLAPANTGTIVLLGLVGRSGWAEFADSSEAQDGLENPLDRWSKRLIDALALKFGAVPIYPFSGPPYFPFQRWAAGAESLFPSPLGLLIHPDFGLWHSYRGALAFTQVLNLPPRVQAQNPCESCSGKPCLSACPVSAFSGESYNVPACAAHLRSAGQSCTTLGCAARNACPIGSHHQYGAAQTQFYMAAFRRSHP